MDGLKFESHFIKGLVSKALVKAIEKKFGCETNIQLNDFVMAYDSEKEMARIGLNVDVQMDKVELEKLIKKFM